MSYPKDLDECTDLELYDELYRRAKTRDQGKCDYCLRPLGAAPSCRFPDRHGPVLPLPIDGTASATGNNVCPPAVSQ